MLNNENTAGSVLIQHYLKKKNAFHYLEAPDKKKITFMNFEKMKTYSPEATLLIGNKFQAFVSLKSILKRWEFENSVKWAYIRKIKSCKGPVSLPKTRYKIHKY